MMDLLAIDRTFIEGSLAAIAAIVLFVGSVYVLVAAIVGSRMAYLVVATGFFGFMLILSALWVFGAPGTPRFLGPKGELPGWVAAGAGSEITSPTFPEIEEYPGGPWREAEEAHTEEIEPVTLAVQEFLVEEASNQFRRQAVQGQLTPEDFAVRNIRFAESGGTELAAATAFPVTGGREVLVLAYKDPGNEPVPSYIALGASVLGFLVHLPFLDRAERRRKDVLTGGDQAPWRGPA